MSPFGASRWVGLNPVLLTAGYQSAGNAGILWLMQYGRIVRITYTLGQPYATYIVAEESAAKAAAMMKAQIEADASVECIGRASKELLRAIGLSAGQFKKVDPEL